MTNITGYAPSELSHGNYGLANENFRSISALTTSLDGLIVGDGYENVTLNGSRPIGSTSQVGLASVVSLSLLFCIIGIVGIVGNSLVILIILCDGKMRRSVTNLFIMNLAISDLLVMLFGIPDIVMFMLNRGWLLGLAWCRLQRYVLVFSVYSSVATQVSVCIERSVINFHHYSHYNPTLKSFYYTFENRQQSNQGCVSDAHLRDFSHKNLPKA